MKTVLGFGPLYYERDLFRVLISLILIIFPKIDQGGYIVPPPPPLSVTAWRALKGSVLAETLSAPLMSRILRNAAINGKRSYIDREENYNFRQY